MSTKQNYAWGEIKKGTYFSAMRTIIETGFYGNNVYPVESLKEAYKLAYDSPGTVVTDLPVYEPEKTGLPADAKILLFNDGNVGGRAAAARCILGSNDYYGNPVTEAKFGPIIREAIYQTRNRALYHAQAYIGLAPEFMVKAHLCIPEGEENIMYSWLYNFQYLTEEYYKMYSESKEIPEGDLYIFSDPQWSHPDFPMGLAFFAPEHNCACLLGMRYFGEHKKGTLTLAWGVANRNGFVSCHGGQKRYNLKDGSKFVAGVFGLSGSGKSTITHAHHGGKYDITVLHDDAFVIDRNDASSVALEPAYFDKTQDYPMDSEDNKYLVTVQNNGVTLDDQGHKVLVTEDIRNGNGRAMKSKLWSPNRVDVFHEPANAIIWLMKDPTLPPVMKIDDPVLASTMGATLATKRTTAERLAPGVDPDALVVEPYANPFRTYRLADDYVGFRSLFADKGLDCYIFNTGHFGEKKVTPQITLGSLEAIIEGTAAFTSFGNIDGMSYLPVDGFDPDFKDAEYKKQLVARMKDRIDFISSRDEFNKLPGETLDVLKKVVEQAEKI
ncbi:phosphoenolpyruvate carboxykinase (ATP) [Christensenella timonensis]|uniref:phosphoenolpyruvate carboxykinase (ATP) n=1 Tax=Christensenella timonensis TaxID=1816678 RepID=UPI00082A2CD2|nr:phosphoenolpyruvate carboxykinase (ATP) [Christensenella timonensis]